MIVVRPVKTQDLECLYELAGKAKVGLTTLPRNRKILKRRIQKSLKSFAAKSKKPGDYTYLFVMEDLSKKRVVGTASVVAKVGVKEPFYTYQLKTAKTYSKLLKVRKTIPYVVLKIIRNGPSEVGTLFLDPSYRHGGNGRLLSFSRYLFMAQYPQCFQKEVIAELRGVIFKNEHSPFWDALGKYFFEVEFKKADLMVMQDKSFIADLMPKHPIYLPLLPPSAREVIGQVHPETLPALILLKKQGFKVIDEIDIFEAGPVLKVKVKDIKTVKESHVATVRKIIPEDIGEEYYLVANADNFHNFKVTSAPMRVFKKGQVVLTKDAAKALNLRIGSKIRYVPVKKAK